MVWYQKTKEEASIVLVGSFNPAIFHPEWIIRHGLMSEREYDVDKIMVSREITRFKLDWVAIDVFINKFIARTNEPSQYIQLRDLATGIFNILSHTPIDKLGMNYNIHNRSEVQDSSFHVEILV